MKAFVRSIRIAPKKADLVARIVRGMTVPEAQDVLQHTHKKAARIIENLLKSAVANASHNDQQNSADLIVKTIVVNKAQTFHRGVPMARGRMRPLKKHLSHIELVLGIGDGPRTSDSGPRKKKDAVTKAKSNASQESKKTVKSSGAKPKKSEALPPQS